MKYFDEEYSENDENEAQPALFNGQYGNTVFFIYPSEARFLLVQFPFTSKLMEKVLFSRLQE